MDPSYLIAIASTAIVGYIENVFGAIRNIMTKLHARHLHKLLSNPETIEKAEKVNRNIQSLPKDQIKDIYNEVDHIERLNQQRKDLEIASKLIPENMKLTMKDSSDRLHEELKTKIHRIADLPREEVRKDFGKYLPDYNDSNGLGWWKVAELALYGTLIITAGFILFAFFHGDLGTLDEIWKSTKGKYDKYTPNWLKGLFKKRFFWTYKSPLPDPSGASGGGIVIDIIPNWKEMSLKDLKKNLADHLHRSDLSDKQLRSIITKGKIKSELLPIAIHYLDKVDALPSPVSEKTIASDPNLMERLQSKFSKIFYGENAKYSPNHINSPVCLCPQCLTAKVKKEAEKSIDQKSDAIKKLQDFVSDLGANPPGTSGSTPYAPSDASSSASGYDASTSSKMVDPSDNRGLRRRRSLVTSPSPLANITEETDYESDTTPRANTVNLPINPTYIPSTGSSVSLPELERSEFDDSDHVSNAGTGNAPILCGGGDKWIVDCGCDLCKEMTETTHDLMDTVIERAILEVRHYFKGDIPLINHATENLFSEEVIAAQLNSHNPGCLCPRCVIAAIDQLKHDFKRDPDLTLDILSEGNKTDSLTLGGGKIIPIRKSNSFIPFLMSPIYNIFSKSSKSNNSNNIHSNNTLSNSISTKKSLHLGNSNVNYIAKHLHNPLLNKRTFHSSSCCFNNLPTVGEEEEDFDHSFEYEIDDLTDFFAVPDLMNNFYDDLFDVSYEEDEYIRLNITITGSAGDDNSNIPVLENFPLRVLVKKDQFHFASFLKYKLNYMFLLDKELDLKSNITLRFDFSYVEADEY